MIFINFIKKSIEVNKFLLILCFWIQFGNCVFANEGETLIGRNIEVADIEFYHLAYAESTSVAQLDSLNQAYNSAITDPLSKILNLFAYSKALSKRGKSKNRNIHYYKHRLPKLFGDSKERAVIYYDKFKFIYVEDK